MLGFIIPFLFPKEFGTVRDAVGNWIGERIGDLKNFLGLSPTPSTTPSEQISNWKPPYQGGQCATLYRFKISATYSTGTLYAGSALSGSQLVGAPLSDAQARQGSGVAGAMSNWKFSNQKNAFGTASTLRLSNGFQTITWAAFTNGDFVGASITWVERVDGLPDNCGNLPNPNPQPTLPYEQGGANAASPYTSNQLDTVYEGLPLALPTNLLGVLAGLAGLIGGALDALDGIKKIGDAIGTIQKLLDLLLKDKERRDRANPIFKKKLIGFWREIVDDDGYISLNWIPIGNKFAIPYAIQIVVESFPSTASRLLGTKSPDIGSDPYPLFYLQLQNNSFGIREVVHVRSLNSFHYLDSLDRGCFYNFRQNPECKAKFRVFYEIETDEVQAQ